MRKPSFLKPRRSVFVGALRVDDDPFRRRIGRVKDPLGDLAVDFHPHRRPSTSHVGAEEIKDRAEPTGLKTRSAPPAIFRSFNKSSSVGSDFEQIARADLDASGATDAPILFDSNAHEPSPSPSIPDESFGFSRRPISNSQRVRIFHRRWGNRSERQIRASASLVARANGR